MSATTMTKAVAGMKKKPKTKAPKPKTVRASDAAHPRARVEKKKKQPKMRFRVRARFARDGAAASENFCASFAATPGIEPLLLAARYEVETMMVANGLDPATRKCAGLIIVSDA